MERGWTYEGEFVIMPVLDLQEILKDRADWKDSSNAHHALMGE